MKKMEELRIAFIGVSHWHVPLYLRALKKQNLNIVAVSDPDEEKAQKVADELDCICYSNAEILLEKEQPDFVFAFAPHNKMPELAELLIKKNIPFTIEKPLGLSVEDVREVERLAEEKKLFCAIPFVWRYSDLIQNFKKEVNPKDILHLAFKFIAGPTSRYEKPSPWMLDSKQAGGGCMTNLGVHFIDMAMFLTNSDHAEVLASSYHYASKYDIETYATSLVKLSSGATLLLETGYAFPMDEEQRDNRWNIVTTDGYYTLGDNRFEKRRFGEKTVSISMSTDSDVYYADFVLESLRQYLEQETPRAGLPELAATREILDEMNRMAKTSV